MLNAMKLQHMIVTEVSQANVAVIRFLTWLLLNVSISIYLVYLAIIELTRVGSGMNLKLFTAGESLAAAIIVAFIRFFPGMRSVKDNNTLVNWFGLKA